MTTTGTSADITLSQEACEVVLKIGLLLELNEQLKQRELKLIDQLFEMEQERDALKKQLGELSKTHQL